MTPFDLIDLTVSLQNMDELEFENGVPKIEEDFPKIEEIPENTYACSACGSICTIDPMLIYPYLEWETYKPKDLARMNYWHSKYSYAKEIEPGYWLTFCRRVCEIKYNRQDEEGWEFSANKK